MEVDVTAEQAWISEITQVEPARLYYEAKTRDDRGREIRIYSFVIFPGNVRAIISIGPENVLVDEQIFEARGYNTKPFKWYKEGFWDRRRMLQLPFRNKERIKWNNLGVEAALRYNLDRRT